MCIRDSPWSDGKRVFKTATTGTMAFRAMQKLAATDTAIAARLDLFQHGVLEEFYDYKNDPDALNNLIDDPEYAEVIAEHREMMRKTMVESNDPLLEVFEKRSDAQFRSQAIEALQVQADARRSKQKKKKSKNKAEKNPAKNAGSKKANRNLFRLKMPPSAIPGEDFIVTVEHKLSNELGKQKFHVTLKDADGKRVDRIVESAAGTGQLSFTFKIPSDFDSDSVRVSGFVGEDYSGNLLHLTEGPVEVARGVEK